MRRFVQIGVVAATIVALTATSAETRTRRAQTRLDASTIQATVSGGQVTQISGTITSPKQKCVPGRPVDITFGPSQSLQQPFGSGTTDAQGRFSVSGSAPSGSFFAIYIQKVRLRKTVCRTTAFFGQLPQ